MKYPLLLLLSAIVFAFSACDTPEADHPGRGRPVTTTTSTTETDTIRTPVGGASTSTTVRSY
jgi:hypothetical protein